MPRWNHQNVFTARMILYYGAMTTNRDPVHTIAFNHLIVIVTISTANKPAAALTTTIIIRTWPSINGGFRVYLRSALSRASNLKLGRFSLIFVSSYELFMAADDNNYEIISKTVRTGFGSAVRRTRVCTRVSRFL